MLFFISGLLTFIIAIIVLTVLVLRVAPGFGGRPKGSRLKRIISSKNYHDGVFQNTEPTRIQLESVNRRKLIREMFRKGNNRIPEFPVMSRKLEISEESKSDLKVTWLGHSTAIIEMNGFLILTDPVFSKRVSPFSFVGTKNFDFTNSYSAEELPKIDVVLISHDHYDHLDRNTILKLKNKVTYFIMPLGVGSHLERWGIEDSRIIELDWWEEKEISGIRFTATPARHFSGRRMNDRFKTLWASFVIEGKKNKVFFGGDSGYHSKYEEIGAKYGEFDICLLECGQYNDNWPFIHMTPEQTVLAAIDLKAKIVLPIHWAKIRLSLHPWIEPIERFINQAKEKNVDFVTPLIGETVKVGLDFPRTEWWKGE